MTQPNDQEMEYDKYFWGLANVTVGFSIVQTVAFLFALASGKGDLSLSVACHIPLAVSLALAATGVYVVLIAYFQHLHWLALQKYSGMPLLRRHFRTLNVVRIVAVAIMGAVSVHFILATGMNHPVCP
jgi:hypothetical protein